MMKFGAGIAISKLHLGLTTQSIKWVSPLKVTNFKGSTNAFYIEAGVRF